MKFIKTVLLYFLVVAIGCKNNKEQDKELQETQSENVTIQVQGHREIEGIFRKIVFLPLLVQ